MQTQTTATRADLVRFAYQLERIRTGYQEAHNKLVEARIEEDAARDAYDKIGTVEALGRVVAYAQKTFDLFDQFAALAVEIQPVTSTEQKLELLASQAGLASAFRPRVSIPELILAGVDGTDGAMGPLRQLMVWGTDDAAKLGAQRAREARDWLKSEIDAAERGCAVCEPAEGWH
jgi:hypothetical protein